MKNIYFKRYRRQELVSLIFDFLAIIAYITIFLMFFRMIKLPLGEGGNVDLGALAYPQVYQWTFGEIKSETVNTVLTLMALFLVVAIPMFVIGVKKLKNGLIYDVDLPMTWAKFFQALISLLLVNPISFVIKLISTFTLLRVVKDYGFIGFIKNIPSRIKQLFEKKPKEEKEPEEEDEDTIRLKKNISRQNFRKLSRMFFTYMFLVLIALFIMIPFYWMVIASLMTYYESSVNPNPSLFLLFSDTQWINYKTVLQELNFGLYIKNTVIVALVSTAGTIITTILAAYAFAKIQFKGRETLFSILIMTMMVPGEIFIITNFITVSGNGFGWIAMGTGNNHYFLAMTIPFMTSISYIFFLRQSFKQVPDSLYRAARVDGCSDFKYLTRVMIPIASPIIFTITILNILGAWNAFIWPRLITSTGGTEGQQYWLISVALRDASFNVPGGDRIMYNLQIAASALVTVPLIIIFLVFRKYIMNGIGRSGTKG
ncbi:MAG TPA: carbohydrate ABC transporter permease [Bacillota bacterium]|nr:carbohydrate ABC transporter permease [Bacillota bacterium]